MKPLLAAPLLLATASLSHAALVDVTVTVTNLAETNGIAFAPTRVGFGNGTFDAFNINEAPSVAIESIAEGGTGSDWFPAFALAEPNAVTGTVVNGGPAIPSGNAGVGNGLSSTATATFRVDTDLNGRFFTFANMVIPSNDLFLGNDNAIELLDANGMLLLTSIVQTGAQIWDANSEVANTDNAAFVVGGTNANRIEEGGVVEFDFSELAAFQGVATPAGYNLDQSGLTAASEIFRLDFTVTPVPEPSTSLLAFFGVAALLKRRR